MEKIVVWHLPTRIVRRFLVAAFAVVWISGANDDWRTMLAGRISGTAAEAIGSAHPVAALAL